MGRTHDPQIGPQPQIGFAIVAIGASAGGLEAVTAMFHNSEPRLGLGYIS